MMHLEGPWLSSISTRKRAEKITKAQREELERNWRDRNKRLKELGLSKQTFEEFLDFVNGRKTEKTQVNTKVTRCKPTFTIDAGLPDLSYRTQTKKAAAVGHSANDKVQAPDGLPGSKEESSANVPLEITRPDIWVKGPTCSKPTPTYTGTKVVGIGTMHKSNMVPIFSDQEAEDISRMRR